MIAGVESILLVREIRGRGRAGAEGFPAEEPFVTIRFS